MSTHTPKPTIMYVDDEIENLNVFNASFQRDFEVLQANSGDAALSLLEKTDVKVVITDQKMPGITGLELIQRLSKARPYIKNIIITGYTDVDLLMASLNQGNVYRFFMKPWSYDELKQSVDNALHLYDVEQQNRDLLKELTLANKKLEQYNETLEQEVDSRTRTLLDTIAVRDKFLDIIAHDIKQPVISMQGFLQILQTKYDRYNDEKRKKIISILNDSSSSLNNLIEDLLNWTKSRLEKIDFTPRLFDMEVIFKQVSEQLSFTVLDKKIDIRSELQKNLMVFADPGMMKIVVRNLLSNAIKFSHYEGIVAIHYFASDQSLTFCIEDRGVGIPADSVKYMFDASKIISTRGTKGEKGSGLGLRLCKEFIDKNNGKIWVESEESKGSKFCFSLPVKEQDV